MSNTVSQFGQNQWLVDEMYERFAKDPSSVDESWHEFFKANPQAASASGRNSSNGTAAAGGDAKKAAEKSSDLTVDDVTPTASAKDVAAKPDSDAAPARKARGEGVPAPVRTPETRNKPDIPAPPKPATRFHGSPSPAGARNIT